ncbi:hypothetical protein J7J08_05530 [Stenotrophomonas sp. ISL-67]|uniref:hypothetical protein n=1 Tax=Stenotrophomonas sp. ISL-67 TaxID=2819171 RepID=UPI001BEAEE2B|nr:hypothetical protein [Stenotrophomonas sp. ISL-67]MBT2767091.1 hypothetical protein [Stenotrophomonas sp. ISL-67]
MDLELVEPAVLEYSFRWLAKGGNLVIGVHLELGWCVRVDGDVTLLDTERRFVPVTPLLKVPFNEFSGLLKRASLRNEECRQLILDFPVELFLKYVFHTSCSGYWPELALDWLEAQESSWPMHRAELAGLSESRSMPQKARQRANRMLRISDGSRVLPPRRS